MHKLTITDTEKAIKVQSSTFQLFFFFATALSIFNIIRVCC